MSLNFEKPLSGEDQSFLREIMGERLVATDEKIALFQRGVIDQKKMKAIANQTNQVVSVELNDEGDIKTLSDGSQYLATKTGWKKLPRLVQESSNG